MRRRAAVGILAWGLVLATGSAALAAGSGDVERTAQRLAQAVEDWKVQATPWGHESEVAFTRDPLQPLVNAQGQVIGPIGGLQSGLSVRGIIWSEQHPMAVIGDELVGEGETVGRYTITKILQDRVEVQAGSETKVVLLERGVATKPAAAATATP